MASPGERTLAPLLDEDAVSGLHLEAGTNVLVLKVINEMKDWAAAVRFTVASGAPVQGLQVHAAVQ